MRALAEGVLWGSRCRLHTVVVWGGRRSCGLPPAGLTNNTKQISVHSPVRSSNCHRVSLGERPRMRAQ